MVGKQTQILKCAIYSCGSTKSRSVDSSSLRSIVHVPYLNRIQVPNPNITCLNKMINDFSKTGDLASAQSLFDQMPDRDVVSWNSLMTAYAQNGQCDEVFQIFSEMQRHNLKPNHTSFSTVLSSCAKLGALDLGKQIHGLSIKSRSSENVFVATSLIMMYSKCKVFDCLIHIFDGIDFPNLASWNALISGFVLNHRIDDARGVFDRMPSRNVVSWTAMITGYIEVKKVRTAFELFSSMPVKNLVSWSVMLGGFVCNGQFEEAIEFFTEMLNNGIQAPIASIIKVISACSGLKNPKQGRKIHGYVIKLGFYLDAFVEASLVLMYSKCLNAEEAKLEFDKMERKFIGSWNSLICGYVNNNKVDEARKLFDKMKERDNISWNSMINGYLKVNRIDDAIELFFEMPETTVETTTALVSSLMKTGRLDEAHKLFSMIPRGDVMAYTALIFGYIEEGLFDKALELFEKMPERNVVTYNVMISGLLQHGKVTEAYQLFNESPEQDAISWNALLIGLVQNGLNDEAFLVYQKMMLSGISPSKLVIASLLRASARVAIQIHGEQIHAVAIKLGHESCLVVGNSLINMYCKCGDMLIAKSIFDRMAEHDLVTWNAVIYGYAFNCLGRNSIETFEKMKRTGIKPDDVTFLGVLSACAHECLLEEAQHYFNSMRCDYGMEPRLTHYACMIDLLCRMGMAGKAERLVHSMPFEPDSVIWTSLLSGCRLNSHTKLAEHAANQLVAWDPSNPMPFLHLISIYKSDGRWDDMGRLQHKINKLGSSKRPGCSWIEISYN